MPDGPDAESGSRAGVTFTRPSHGGAYACKWRDHVTLPGRLRRATYAAATRPGAFYLRADDIAVRVEPADPAPVSPEPPVSIARATMVLLAALSLAGCAPDTRGDGEITIEATLELLALTDRIEAELDARDARVARDLDQSAPRVYGTLALGAQR